MQVRPVNRGCDTGHCVISTMSEGRLSGHSKVTSDKPACTDLDPEEDEKEDSKKFNPLRYGTTAAFHG